MRIEADGCFGSHSFYGRLSKSHQQLLNPLCNRCRVPLSVDNTLCNQCKAPLSVDNTPLQPMQSTSVSSQYPLQLMQSTINKC